MPTPSKIIFLPGASGNTDFWKPMAEQLVHPAHKVIFPYPGFGDEPSDADIANIEQLMSRVVESIDQPTALIAQSMGGVLAINAAIQRPDLVTHLVLAATPGGIDTAALGVQDWRSGFLKSNPHVPDWLARFNTDLTADIQKIRIPTLLLWGDSDPVSPTVIGMKLNTLLQNSNLHIIAGGTHNLASDFASILAPVISAYLASTAPLSAST